MSRSARALQRVDASSSTLTAYDRQILAESPVLYLPLSGGSGGSADHALHGHSGTSVQSPSLTSLPNGERATVFDGATQYIEVADDDALSVTATGVLTIEAWMRPDVLQFPNEEGSGYVYWLGKNTSGNSEYSARMYSATNTETPPRPNRISGYAFNLTGGLGAGSFFQDTVSVGEWIHYVLVINSVSTSSTYPTGYTKVFKDGVQRDQDSLLDYNIVPQNGSAPFRIGSVTLNSFFQGALGKVAVYNYELSATQVHSHYRMIVPAVSGSASLIKHVGDASTSVTGTKLTITVPPAGVSAGSTLIAKAAHAYTSGSPSMADSRGNTWTLHKTSPNASLTMRAALFSAQIDTALQGGDTIQLATSASVGNKTFSVDEFSNLIFGTALDVVNNNGSTSTTPGTSLSIATTQADDLVYGMVAVNGPLSEGYTEDGLGEFTGLVRTGTSSGSGDVTVNGAFKSVAVTGTYGYKPTLAVSEPWVEIIAAFKAGIPVVTPPATGSASFIQGIGTVSAVTSGTTLTISVPTGGIPAGHTLIVRTCGDYTSTGASVTDSRGNTYTRDRSSGDSGTTMRASIFSCAVTTALQSGDTITITWPSAVNVRAAAVDEFARVLSPIAVDVQNGASGTSTSPSVTAVTTNGDDLMVSLVAVAGPSTEGYTDDTIHLWSGLSRIGTTTASTNRTLNGAYRAVAAAGTYQYQPTLENSQIWIDLVVAYKAG